jgi:WbqC-like protein family
MRLSVKLPAKMATYLMFRPMRVAIHEPQYLPWLPYLAKADVCDVFAYLDNVQFQKNDLQNRDHIKTAQGARWLTVPVNASLGQRVRETRIADQ